MAWRLRRLGAFRHPSASILDLSLTLPSDHARPFGGEAHQRIELAERRLRMTLPLTAGDRALPAKLGWHPWFRKPDRMVFAPTSMYPRDAHGITTLAPQAPSAGPWDDCFLNDQPVALQRGRQLLCLRSACDHWVVDDETIHATCVEPQSGPPDAFNLRPDLALDPGDTLSRWFSMQGTDL